LKLFVYLLLLSGSATFRISAEPLFEKLSPSATGAEFVHAFEEDHEKAFLYHSGFAVSGICLGDVNGDERLDLYLVSGPGANRLFLSDDSPGISFRPHDDAGLAGGGRWGSGASLVDIDNDGDLDLYQCNYDAPNQLFLNDGSATFTELEGAAGLGVVDASMAASFADVDNDGDLDMFLLCNRYYRPEGRPERPPFRAVEGEPVILEAYQKYYHILPKPGGGYKVDDYGREDYFFLNVGPGEDGLPRFEDFSAESGLKKKGFGLSCVWWDFDTDGDLDLFVANDFTVADRLFRNEGVDQAGVPIFVDVIADHFPSITWSSMGSDCADVNRDGLPDLLSVDMSATSHFKAKLNMGELSPAHRQLMGTGTPRQAMRNHLFLNNGTRMFSEGAWAMGVASSDWSWAAKFGDLDNDGWQDLFIANGIARNFTNADRAAELGDLALARIGNTEWDLFKDGEAMLEKNLAFQNLGGKKFNKRPDWGLGLLGMSYSAAMGDLDDDGDIDLVVSDLGQNVKIYQNQNDSGGSLRIRLVGAQSNRMGIGARVVVSDSDGVAHTRWMNPWTGFQSQDDMTLHFGLGASTAKTVAVTWPSGSYQEVLVDAGTRELTIAELGRSPAPPEAAFPARFVRAEAPDFIHQERDFDDFIRQPLLPGKLSQEGPGLACGDVDGDGDLDLYIGGANRQEGALFINDRGRFTKSPQESFGALSKYADENAALFFDADSDGDLDLLVVTGGTEYEADSPIYHDHLYLNQGEDGEVRFVKAADGAFPKLKDSGSCVAAADYDADGDIDLFIGARSIPGKYPLAPHSRLLENQSSGGEIKFVDATPEGLERPGLVTGAAWADFDRDADPDLVLSLDWGAVMIFQNEQGQLNDISRSAGTSDLLGWWRCVHVVDVDGDGLPDIVAGNAGINTKYKSPSAAHPALLYYGDMDGSGEARIVEAKLSGGGGDKDRDRPLPVRGRS